jgi:hypothetical protein
LLCFLSGFLLFYPFYQAFSLFVVWDKKREKRPKIAAKAEVKKSQKKGPKIAAKAEVKKKNFF